MERFTDDIGLEVRENASPHFRHGLASFNILDYLRQMRLGPCNLALRLLGLVGAHACHVDVGVGHYEAVVGMHWQSNLGKLLSENLFRNSAVVATGDGHPYIAGRFREFQLLHEFHHELWRTPGVDGEDEAHSFVFRKGIVKMPFPLGFRNENELLVKGLCDAFCNKAAVAATGKVEDHDVVIFESKNTEKCRKRKILSITNVNADEFAVTIECVGRPHFVVINIRIIPYMDDVVVSHDFQGE